MGTDLSRWQDAQQYERRWWEGVEAGFDFEYLEAFAEEVEHDLKERLAIGPETRILEIGGGPAGIVSHMPRAGRRVSIDPLEAYFRRVPSFTAARDPAVEYLEAEGEHLPFEDASFDLVLMDNVLDHCRKPVRVLKETHRVLAPSGILYLKQHTFHRWGLFVRRLMELFKIDKGHPQSFSRPTLKSLLARYGWTILHEEHSGYLPHWLFDLRAPALKNKLKLVLFVTWNTGLYILQKDRAEPAGGEEQR
ncbi:methyltransferase domain-containing protein [bacterium]|nr:methyltransferase domain-containing protein [bacterium]